MSVHVCERNRQGYIVFVQSFDSNDMKYPCILNQDLILSLAEILRSKVRLVQRLLTYRYATVNCKGYNYELSILHHLQKVSKRLIYNWAN